MNNAKRIVILVDHRNRDLMLAALLAHHLQARGIECFLEPLEAYHAVLAAYAPDLIVFNHINSSHLVRYSQRLAQLNVLTAVLPNEGIIYDEASIRYNSGRYHKEAHIDYYFCWNEKHQAGLREHRLGQGATKIEVCGVPRFDFYFKPWSRLFPRTQNPARPVLLVCTNLAFARFAEIPESDADKFFAPFKDRIPQYRNYREAIQVHARERERLLQFLEALLANQAYDIVLRPHPRETTGFYEAWLDRLPGPQRQRIRLDTQSNITELILNSDLELSCETCTTALEAWIAGKPTIELVFEKHPLFYHPEIARLNVCCEQPDQLLALVEQQLKTPAQPQLAEARIQHLAKWCHRPDGNASLAIANLLAEAVLHKPEVRREFTFNEYRKGIKLKLLRTVNLPYNFDPVLKLKFALFPGRYATKDFVYKKTLRPSDGAEADRDITASLRLQ
ncbi:MAG: surface carbohydrate biosynthesis protein [Verrucomicrobiota bacterium]